MVQLEGLGKLRTFIDLIGTQNRNSQGCSIAPQPSTLLCFPNHMTTQKILFRVIISDDCFEVKHRYYRIL
jgi:hypothetical protein